MEKPFDAHVFQQLAVTVAAAVSSLYIDGRKSRKLRIVWVDIAHPHEQAAWCLALLTNADITMGTISESSQAVSV